MTLPLIYVLNNGPKEVRKELINIVKNQNENPKKVKRAVKLVIDHGGIEYAHKRMLEYKEKALDLIKDIPHSDSKESIIGLVEYTTEVGDAGSLEPLAPPPEVLPLEPPLALLLEPLLAEIGLASLPSSIIS